MSTPNLLLGRKGRAALLLAESGATDDGAAFQARLQPNAVAPAGVRGECAFRTLYLAVTHSAGTTLQLVPVVDGRVLPAELISIVLAPAPEPVTETFEIALGQSLEIAGLEVARLNLIGTWFTARIATSGALVAGDLVFDALEIEFEVLREGKPEVS